MFEVLYPAIVTAWFGSSQAENVARECGLHFRRIVLCSEFFRHFF
jgi:hypothetical protein